MHAYHCILEADILFSEYHMKQVEMHLSVKEHQELGDTVRWQETGMEQNLSEIPQKKSKLYWPFEFCKSSFQNVKTTYFCCFKAHSLQNFLMAALGNAHIQSTYTS